MQIQQSNESFELWIFWENPQPLTQNYAELLGGNGGMSEKMERISHEYTLQSNVRVESFKNVRRMMCNLNDLCATLSSEIGSYALIQSLLI